MSAGVIAIDIDELVLHALALPPRRLDRIRQEVAAQLERLIERHGLPGRAAPTITIGLLRLPHSVIRPGSPDREIARQIALAVFRRLHEDPRTRRGAR